MVGLWMKNPRGQNKNSANIAFRFLYKATSYSSHKGLWYCVVMVSWYVWLEREVTGEMIMAPLCSLSHTIMLRMHAFANGHVHSWDSVWEHSYGMCRGAMASARAQKPWPAGRERAAAAIAGRPRLRQPAPAERPIGRATVLCG